MINNNIQGVAISMSHDKYEETCCNLKMAKIQYSYKWYLLIVVQWYQSYVATKAEVTQIR